MALSETFPKDPFVILDPKERWFPADESLRETSAEKLLPPLVRGCFGDKQVSLKMVVRDRAFY